MELARVWMATALVWSLGGRASLQAQVATVPDRASLTSTQRPVTVPDVIRMTRLTADLNPEAVQPSPDCTYQLVVVKHGDLDHNTNEYAILLWRSATLLAAPHADTLVRLASSSNRPAIDHVTWWADNQTIAFLGEHPGERHQLYTFNIRTRRLRKITSHPTNLLSYSMTPTGDRVTYVAEEPAHELFDQTNLRTGLVVSTQSVWDLVLGHNATPKHFQLFIQTRGHPSHLMHPHDVADGYVSAPRLSPNGQYILIATRLGTIPSEWNRYSDPRLRELVKQPPTPAEPSWLMRYELVNTTTGQGHVLLDAPLGVDGSEAAWAPDSRSVVLAGVYLPLASTAGADSVAQRSAPVTAEVTIETGDIQTIDHGDLQLIRWDRASGRLVFAEGRESWAPGIVAFRKHESRWERTTDTTTLESLPAIVVEEDLHTPPRLVAVDPKTHQRVGLLELNPQFKALRFGRVEEVRWKGSDGHEVAGGLYYPVDYVPGQRYPLVIQTHRWVSGRFWIDGPYPTAFAAQPLAGRGIMVLQADESFAEMGTPGEVDREVATFEGAIDDLDQRGLIDRQRVGIIGFSRTCLFIKYALTHSSYHFAAASVTDGYDAGYVQYILSANAAWESGVEGVNGGLPFGDGLERWRVRSPGFNVDKVQTPLRILAESKPVALGEWEWYAGLTRLGKPVEMVVLPDGEHLLQKPWERMVSLQGTVDWFAFWLKGEEAPDAAKAEQYARWRGLRKLQQSQMASDTTQTQHRLE